MVARFPGEGLFDRVARVVCEAECLPRKELYEAWEVARRVRRRFRGGRVMDLACGHGLLAHLLVLLDDTSAEAIAIDARIPASAARLSAAMTARWPRLSGRVHVREARMEDIALHAGDVVVSVHACGSLTDTVLDRATAARARVAVLPCCHDVKESDDGGLQGWLDGPLAVDVTRAARMNARGYIVHTQKIPAGITPKNRLLLGYPTSS